MQLKQLKSDLVKVLIHYEKLQPESSMLEKTSIDKKRRIFNENISLDYTGITGARLQIKECCAKVQVSVQNPLVYKDIFKSVKEYCEKHFKP